VACLDAYEATGDLSYFNFARAIVDRMIEGFFDSVSGGFFDTEQWVDKSVKKLGVLDARRKPFQDSPTPAGNSVAAIALSRMYGYTNESSYHEKAQQTLEVLAGVAGQYGLFAATYGIAAVHLAQPHMQIVILGDGANANRLQQAAAESFALNKGVIRLKGSAGVAANLPPALAETIPHLSQEKNEAVALVCSGFTCLPPISDPEDLRKAAGQQARI
jgi:uncharacterized protein